MLFDLRGRGRKNTIKVIYISLAFLMGGGLVLFGIGGNTSGGGLVDAITGSEGGDTGADRYEKMVKDSLATLQTDPDNRTAYEDLISARVQLAGFGERYDSNSDTYTEEGLAILREAVKAWDEYLKLDIPIDDQKGVTANRIATAYIYLDQPENFITAQEIVAEARNATGPYQQLAAAAYQLGQIRKGDLAAEKAIELASDEQREQVEAAMEQAKNAAGSATDGAQAVPSPTATPEATETPEPTAEPKKKPAKKSAKQRN